MMINFTMESSQPEKQPNSKVHLLTGLETSTWNFGLREYLSIQLGSYVNIE